MCGIAGTLGPTVPDTGRIASALSTMARRGPDASGHRVLDLGAQKAALLHTRLSVIDLDARADQPFERDGLVISYNGEIYNYLEVKADLEALGHRFKTASDTEVLVAAWRQWGPDALDRLEGMWAFAIVDTQAGTLYKSGDTFFDGVFELPPSTYLTLSSPALSRPEFYWQLKHIPRPMSAADALEEARERLFRSVELRLRADVPVAFCLSGGVDSATLAAIAAKKLGADIHCFSIIDADERYNESDNITAMVEALGCDHHVTRTSTEGFFARMEDIVAYHDAPVATISYYVHSFLSEAIHDAGYKVAVSGTGADEIYTGYYDHYSMWLAQMWRRSQIDSTVDFETLLTDWKGGFGAHVQNPLLQDPMTFVRDPGQRGHITLDQDFFESLLATPFHEDFEETEFTRELLRNRMMNELFAESIPVILHEDGSSAAGQAQTRIQRLD